MNTDTKTVARWDIGTDGLSDEVKALWHYKGRYVLFTDHERVVGELDRLVRNVDTENEFLRTTLAASRAEVEGLIEVAKVYLHGEYQDPEVEYSSEYRARRYKEGQALAKAIAAAMEKGNV